MKKTLQLLPLLSLISLPTHAIVLGDEGTIPAPQPTQPVQAAPQPQAAPTVPAQAMPTQPVQSMTVQGQTQTLQPGQMTPEQLSKATGMSKEQLQVVAKEFHQQMQAGQPTTEVVQATVNINTPVAPRPEETKRDLAFNSLLEDVLPLSPDQIMRLHKFYDMTLQAKSSTPNAPPTPQFSSIRVNLEPGSSPPVIRLAAGFVSSLLFVDSTGAAWPLTAYSIGDPQNFNIQWDQKSNALFIQSLKPYSHGNLAVRLHHLDTPIMITLVSGQRNVDFRVDLQVPGRGPDAKAPVVDTTFNAKVNPILMNILDGVPPMGSIKLDVSGGPGDAWLNDDKVYFRTKLTVLSPAWLGTVASPDGTHVYEMMITPYIMASHEGKTVNIKLSGL